MLEIYKGVPIPPVNRSPFKNKAIPRRVYPLENMAVGDMIFYPGKVAASVAPHINHAAKTLGYKFTVRQEHARLAPGKAVVCDPDELGAQSGVGVWRTE
jgi:hypothetical protein